MNEDKPNQPENIPTSGVIECEFTVRIEHNQKEQNSYEIKRELSSMIRRRYEYLYHKDFDQELRDSFMRMRLVQQAFQKHFKFLGDKKAYFTDYREIEGSLIITFSVVIVGAFANYGSIRETIDYFADDIQALYNDVLPDKYMISTNKNIKTIYASPQNPTPQPQPTEELNKEKNKNLELENIIEAIKAMNAQNKVNRILIGLTMFVLLVLLAVNLIGGEQDKTQLENQIEQKVQSAIRESKVEDLIRNTEGVKVGDTLVIKRLNK